MKRFLTIPFLLAALYAQAQQPAPAILCGQDLFSEFVRTNYPELANSFDQTFEKARQTRAGDRSPLTVNVVVHVVWNDPVENIADSIIEDQIRVLNEDFNRLNADTGSLRPAFHGVAGNANIHFNLVSIVRVQTSKLFEVDLLGGGLLSELKHAAQGGSDGWNTDQYLNIWVCKIQPLTIFGLPVGQILGFAFPPNNLAHWPANSGAPQPEEDGVALDFRTFGRNNPTPIENPDGSGNLIIRGRSPVHEIGHYFGLRHIWGDGGLLGPNDCAQSDGIDDTPYANAQSAFDCDTSKNTCEQVDMHYNADMPDLIENFMDYASEPCMNMFTQGQVALMRNVLQGPRSGLLNPVSAPGAPSALAEWTVYPNPASERITVAFALPEASTAAVRILGADGRACRVLAPQSFAAGRQQLAVDTRGLTAGIYFVQLQTAAGTAMRKLEIVR